MSEAKGQNDKRPEGNGVGPTRSFDSSVTGPGRQIGPFRIEQELGRGGAGVVYLAHDTKLDRPVAIKSLPPEVKDNPKALSRFTREARVLASLNHPNIATIYDELEEVDGLTYLVLEYVPGQTLAERIANGPLKLEEILTIALQIAEALAAAHEHDIIHRDLKPGNIKITPEGRVKVLDFGLAKAVGDEGMDQQSTVTEPGRVIGTPAYMSPEQARGQATDKRCDIWSFGCVLYEMLTGRVPFEGETVSDTLAAVLKHEPSWRVLPESTPANILVLLRRSLEKEPRRRLRDIGDIAITLEETTTELQRPTLRMKPVEATQSPIEKIAVLPFTSISSEAGEEWFVDGMTDALITQLGKIKAVTVISRTSAMQYKNVSKPISEIAQDLGVDALIEGSVIRVGNDVQVMARLINGRTDERIWGDFFQGTFSDILALQSKATLAIAQEIKVALTSEEKSRIARTETIRPDAYEAFLKGKFFYDKVTPEGMRMATEYFQRAIVIEPDYAEAYAWLSAAYWVPSVWGYTRPHDSFPKAKRAASTAIALDKTLATAHVLAGWIALAYDWDWEKGKESYDQAIKLNPSNADGYQGLCFYWDIAGHFDKASEAIQTALKLDPLSLLFNNSLAWTYSHAGQTEEAMAQRKKILELNPSHIETLAGLAQDYLILSRYAEAEGCTSKAVNIAGRRLDLLVDLASIYALTGRKDEAETLLQELHERAASEYVSPMNFAKLYAILGNTDEAFRLLEKAYKERNWFMLYLRYSWHWDPLRNDPRFDDLVGRMKYPE